MREAVLGDVPTLVELMAEFYAESDYVLDRGAQPQPSRRCSLIRGSGESG